MGTTALAGPKGFNQYWRNCGISVPLFMGITGVNEHVEPIFNAVLLSAVVLRPPLDGYSTNMLLMSVASG